MNRVLVAVLLVLLLIPTIALAQSANDKLIQGIRAQNELDWETAIMFLNDALQLGLSETSLVEAYKYLGFCYIETDQLVKGKEAFESLLNLNPDYQLDPNIQPIYLDIFKVVKSEFEPTGERLLQNGIDAYNELQFRNAISYLDRSLKEELPDNLRIEAHLYLALCYIEDEQTDEAKNAFLKLLEIDADYQIGNELSPKYRDIFNQVKVKVKPTGGTILVKSTPPGASVYFDERLQIVKTPMKLKDVDTRTHTLRISLKGYKDWTGEISKLSWEKALMVQDISTLDINATLIKSPPGMTEKNTGSIYATSEPLAAQVKLDDILQEGRTPMTIADVMAGRHSLKLLKKGYSDWDRKVDVAAGKTAEISARLIPLSRDGTRSIPTVKKGSKLKWYLLGGAVVGGGVAAILLLGGDNGGGGGGDDTPKTTSLTISITVP